MKLKNKLAIGCALIGITGFLVWQNNDIVVNEIEYSNNNIPNSFENFKIIHISDLHDKSFGKNQKNIINEIKKLNGNIMVISGDVFGEENKNLDNAFSFLEQAVELMPVYYVTGNHEVTLDGYETIMKEFEDIGITVLKNRGEKIEINGESIDIFGVDDPKWIRNEDFYDILTDLSEKSNSFKILISHRPERFYEYINAQYDLVFCGHAHGGQIRLPIIGGLFAPNQGILPLYTSGKYVKGKTTMVVSRGLGPSKFPFRIFNRPEIVTLTLKNEL